jgi:NADPH-dependent curcumin reductase CurA
VKHAVHERVRNYGVPETVDYTVVDLADAVSQAHPDSVDVLIDVASDANGFAVLAALIRPGEQL